MLLLLLLLLLLLPMPMWRSRGHLRRLVLGPALAQRRVLLRLLLWMLVLRRRRRREHLRRLRLTPRGHVVARASCHLVTNEVACVLPRGELGFRALLC